MDPVIDLTLRAALALLFAGAVRHKLLDPRHFTATLAEYRLLPARLAPLAAACVILAELGIVLALALRPAWGAAAGAALLGLRLAMPSISRAAAGTSTAAVAVRPRAGDQRLAGRACSSPRAARSWRSCRRQGGCLVGRVYRRRATTMLAACWSAADHLLALALGSPACGRRRDAGAHHLDPRAVGRRRGARVRRGGAHAADRRPLRAGRARRRAAPGTRAAGRRDGARRRGGGPAGTHPRDRRRARRWAEHPAVLPVAHLPRLQDAAAGPAIHRAPRGRSTRDRARQRRAAAGARGLRAGRAAGRLRVVLSPRWDDMAGRQSCYAALRDAGGRARQGTGNTREHLESLFEAMEHGVASIQDYFASQAEHREEARR